MLLKGSSFVHPFLKLLAWGSEEWSTIILSQLIVHSTVFLWSALELCLPCSCLGHKAIDVQSAQEAALILFRRMLEYVFPTDRLTVIIVHRERYFSVLHSSMVRLSWMLVLHIPNKEQRWENFETIGTLRKGLAYPCVAVLHYGSQKHCSQILQEKLKSETPLLRLRVCKWQQKKDFRK